MQNDSPKPQKNTSVTIGLASIPERISLLERTLESLYPQADMIHVYLDGYTHIPIWLNRAKIRAYLASRHGDFGGPGKFLKTTTADGYFLSCDDDLIYPTDYVEKMTKCLDSYPDKTCVGVHGAILRPPISNYFNNRKMLHFFWKLQFDTPVHVLGTGTLCFRPEHVKIEPFMFEAKEKSDIIVARELMRQKTKRICIARPQGWIKEQELPHKDSRIFTRNWRNPGAITRLVNSINWTI